jgi:hypothetical protein
MIGPGRREFPKEPQQRLPINRLGEVSAGTEAGGTVGIACKVMAGDDDDRW